MGDNGTTDKTKLINSDCSDVDVQHPLPADGDSVFEKDIWVSESDIGNFSGSVIDLYNNLHSAIVDSTSNNPKELFIHFHRTLFSAKIALGAVTGNFSNVEIQILNSGGVLTTVIDESADGTKHTKREFKLETTVGFNGVKFIFHTADTVTLSNSVILKSRQVVTRSHGPNGLEYAQDETTGDRISIDHAHAEIHEGRNYTAFSDQEPVTSVILAFRVEDQTRIPHMTVDWKTEESGTVMWYKGATWTPGTGVSFVPINSNHNSINTSILQGDSSGAFLSNEIVLDPLGLSIAGATIIYGESVWSTNQSPAAAGAGSRKEQNLLPGETYVVEITSSPAGGIWGFLDWYEHDPVEV